MKRLLLLLLMLLPVTAYAQTTTVTGTIVDPNGNPYANGTASAAIQIGTGAPIAGLVLTRTVTTNATGAFSFSGTNALSSNQSYNFTLCAKPVLFGQPTVNPTPTQVCFTSGPITVSGASQDVSSSLNPIAASLGPPSSLNPTYGSVTAASMTDTGLTVGNCVQVTAGGLLTTSSGPCGTSNGTLTATGSPATGNLAKWSSATSLTNADLSGDVTTAGGVSTALAATLVTCGANQFSTQSGRTPGCTQPSFSNLSGAISSAQFGSQTANTFLAAPSGSSGNPTFRVPVGADIPAINLAATGNGGITGNLPVGNIAPGSNGQCINTSGSVSVWGSCAGTAGVQVPTGGVNTTTVTVNTSTTALQNLMSYTSASGALNTIGKTFRLRAYGSYNALNTTEGITFEIVVGGSNHIIYGQSGPVSVQVSGVGLFWSADLTCTTTVTGASGAILCGGPTTAQVGGVVGTTTNGVDSVTDFINVGSVGSSVNLTGTVTFQFQISFSQASASNTASQNMLIVEQLN